MNLEQEARENAKRGNKLGDEAREYVYRSRRRKAEQFAFLFWSVGIPASDVVSLDDAGWSQLAAAAGINNPSAETKRMTIVRLRHYERGIRIA